jgi:hypothetical protein
MKMCEDFTLNFADQRTGCCIMTMNCLTLPFSPATYYQKKKKRDCHPPPTLPFSVLPIEDKTK